MSITADDRFSFIFDESGSVTAIAEVDEVGTILPEPITAGETFAMLGPYVVEQSISSNETEWTIYSQDGLSGFWGVAAHGHGILDTGNLDAIITTYVAGTDDNEGTDGDDDFIGNAGNDGDDVYNGNGGNDTLTYQGDTKTKVDLAIHIAQDTGHGLDRLIGIKNVTTGSGDDELSGDDLDNEFNAGGGDDHVLGDGGNDNLSGGDGNDDLSGGVGNDLVHGGTGKDLMLGGIGDDDLNGDAGDDNLSGGDGNDDLSGGVGNDSLAGGTGNDLVHGGTGKDLMLGGIGDDDLNGDAGDDNLSGGDGNDDLSGGVGNDSLAGGTGNDLVHGGTGKDLMLGGIGDDDLNGDAGDDILRGGVGNDRLNGGGEADYLTGGAGADTFVFNSTSLSFNGHSLDVISDFTSGEDIFDVTALHVAYIDQADFSALAGAGEMRLQDGANGATLELDVNGDGTVDMAVLLKGAHSIDAAHDFLF